MQICTHHTARRHALDAILHAVILQSAHIAVDDVILQSARERDLPTRPLPPAWPCLCQLETVKAVSARWYESGAAVPASSHWWGRIERTCRQFLRGSLPSGPALCHDPPLPSRAAARPRTRLGDGNGRSGRSGRRPGGENGQKKPPQRQALDAVDLFSRS